MEELERRLLQRLLTFCQEREVIGPYQLETNSVHIIIEAEYRSFTLHQGLQYLLALTDEEGLADEFFKTISSQWENGNDDSDGGEF